MRDFHVYVSNDAGGAYLSAVMDPKDPVKAEVLKAMSDAFKAAERYREAYECLHAINWQPE